MVNKKLVKTVLSTIAKARSFVQYCVSLSKDKIFNWSYRIVENVWQCNKLNINYLFLELPPPKFGLHCCEQVVAAIPASAWNIHHSLQVPKCKYMFTTEQPRNDLERNSCLDHLMFLWRKFSQKREFFFFEKKYHLIFF